MLLQMNDYRGRMKKPNAALVRRPFTAQSQCKFDVQILRTIRPGRAEMCIDWRAVSADHLLPNISDICEIPASCPGMKFNRFDYDIFNEMYRDGQYSKTSDHSIQFPDEDYVVIVKPNNYPYSLPQYSTVGLSKPNITIKAFSLPESDTPSSPLIMTFVRDPLAGLNEPAGIDWDAYSANKYLFEP